MSGSKPGRQRERTQNTEHMRDKERKETEVGGGFWVLEKLCDVPGVLLCTEGAVTMFFFSHHTSK